MFFDCLFRWVRLASGIHSYRRRYDHQHCHRRHVRRHALVAHQVQITAIYVNLLWYSIRCQTYEGGFSASPGSEAHGGYAYCGLAAIRLLGHQALVDADALLHWLAHKQMNFEGGFQVRIRTERGVLQWTTYCIRRVTVHTGVGRSNFTSLTSLSELSGDYLGTRVFHVDSQKFNSNCIEFVNFKFLELSDMLCNLCISSRIMPDFLWFHRLV